MPTTRGEKASIQSEMPKFRVAICGGGIAGLILAITLGHYASQDAPITVDIYEADPEVRTVGAGITTWPRTWTVMRHLGLYKQLNEVAVRVSDEPFEDKDDDRKPAFTARKANQAGEGYHYARVMAPASFTSMHRRDMMDVLLRHLPPEHTLHTSKRLVKYTCRDDTSSSPITLHFTDGTTAEADVLFGADGIHSPTRMCMYANKHRQMCMDSGNIPPQQCALCKAATPRWTGVLSYRCLIPAEKLYALNPAHATANNDGVLAYSGKDQHIITYLISGGKFLNFIANRRVSLEEGTPYTGSWVTDALREEVVSQYEGWEPEVQQMLQFVERPARWAVHVVDNLPFSVFGNVALLGDAVHAMTPNFGAGGGQAIEDAYMLGRLLADPRVALSHVPSVLRIYEQTRLPFAKDIARRGREVGLMYDMNTPGYYDGTGPSATTADEVAEEKRQLKELGEAIQRMWQWQWTGDSDELWVRAENELEALLAG